MKKRTPKNKFAFLWRLMEDTALSPPAKIVATTLLLKFHNAKNGQCNPSIVTLGKCTGRCRRSIFSDIAELESGGWITIESTKGGSSANTNRYRFNFKSVSSATPLPVQTVAPLPVQNNDIGVQNNVGGVQTVAHEPLRTTLSPSERESGCAVIPFRALAPDGAAREEKEEKFQALCSIWRAKIHGLKEAKARKAFFAVCDAGGSPFEILASAKNWVAKTKPQYLKKLEDWLGDGVWRNDPPPPRAQVRRGGKKSLVALAMNYGSDQ